LSGGINPAPQKRNSQGLALQELAARLSRGNPDQQRGSCPPDAASVGNLGVDLWGRLYAGRRRRVPTPEGVPTSVGRDKPGPTKRTALGLTLQELAARLSRGDPDQQRGSCPPDAASVGNLGVDLWGRLYAGRRRRVPSPEGVPASVGRDKPGPTKKNRAGPHTQDLAARLSGGDPDQQRGSWPPDAASVGNPGSRPVGPALRRPTAPRSHSGGCSHLCRPG